jgi:hypothetical protein
MMHYDMNIVERESFLSYRKAKNITDHKIKSGSPKTIVGRAIQPLGTSL